MMQSREQECAAPHRAGHFPQLTLSPHSLKRIFPLFMLKSNLTPEIRGKKIQWIDLGMYFDKLALLSENIENEAPLKGCDIHMGHSDLEHRDGKYQVIYSPIS